MTYELPNPFLFLSSGLTAGNAAPAFTSSLPSGESDPPAMTDWAGAAPGYQCCVDCGVREPCDMYCPHLTILDAGLAEITKQFEIEPVPAFLTDNRAAQIEEMLELARAEEWPAPPRRRRMVGTLMRRANG